MLSRLAQLSRDSLIYGVGGAAARYTGLILLPIYTRVFSTGEYGILESVSNLGALLLAVAVLGLDGAVPLLYFDTTDQAERRRICTFWVWASIAFAVPLTLVLIVAAPWVSLAASGTTQNAALFAIGVAVLPFSLLQVVFTAILRLTFRPRAYAVLNFSLTTLIAVLSIYLVVFAGMGIAGALWGIFIGTAATSIASAWAARDMVRVGPLSPRLRVIGRRLLRLGMPLVPANVALWVIAFSNTYFLIQLAGPEEAGVFRAGARLVALLSLAIWAFQLAWTPFSLSLAKDPQAPRLYSRVATLFTAGAVGASVLMAAFAPILLRIFTTADYSAAAPVIGVLSLGASALGAYYVVAIGVNLAQRTEQIAWTTLVAAAANIVLNLALIPVWGIVGAGLAMLGANLLSTSLVYFVSQRFHPVPYEPLKLLVIWLAGSACVAAAGILSAAVSLPLWLSVVVGVVLLALFILVLFVTRVLTLREIAVLREAVAAKLSAPVAADAAEVRESPGVPGPPA